MLTITRTIHAMCLLALGALLLALPQATFAKDEQSWVGKIESRPSGGFVGGWIVQGRTFAATSATQIKQEIGPLDLGTCAEVKYTSADGADAATRIERQLDSACGSGNDGGSEQKIYALIEAIPAENVGVWTIGGQNYTSTASTTFKQEHGPFAVGACAEVEFVSAGGTNTTRKIGTEDAFRCGNATFISHARGLIEAFPSGLIGTWQIGGASYEASAFTRFQQRSPFTVGGCVQIAYFVQSGVSVAQEIESEGADDCAATPNADPTTLRKLYAPIETVPASPFIGAWRIGGVDVSATAATRFEQNSAPFAAGVCVEAKYVLDGSTNRLIAVESKPATRCQTGGVAALRAYGAVDSLPAGFAGTWTVGGVTYQTNASTSFEQRFGRFAAGVFVEITYRTEGTNRVATKIETHVAPGGGQIRAVGALESRPSDDTGTWVIGGVSYRGDDAIEVEREVEKEHGLAIRQAAASPLLVAVNAYQASDGTLYATSITASRPLYLPLVQN